jgi:hypothetical protein
VISGSDDLPGTAGMIVADALATSRHGGRNEYNLMDLRRRLIATHSHAPAFAL